MFRSNLATYPYISPDNSYTGNLAQAARALVAALLAVDPARQQDAQPEAAVSSRDNIASVKELYSLAQQFDAVMPNQAAELRYLAGRVA